ncbi:hypothetical protein PoB_007275000, partial [Plakobranchus ocellatus]
SYSKNEVSSANAEIPTSTQTYPVPRSDLEKKGYRCGKQYSATDEKRPAAFSSNLRIPTVFHRYVMIDAIPFRHRA